MSNDDDREMEVVGELRVVVTAVFTLGVIACVLGYLPIGVRLTERNFVVHDEPAGGSLLGLYLLVVLLPGIAVLHRPRWPQILTWVAAAVLGTVVALVLTISPIGYFTRNVEFILLLWPAWIGYSAIAMMLFGICIVVPNVRGQHRCPHELSIPLPIARVRRT